jgi:hypothetical protein
MKVILGDFSDIPENLAEPTLPQPSATSLSFDHLHRRKSGVGFEMSGLLSPVANLLGTAARRSRLRNFQAADVKACMMPVPAALALTTQG